MTEHTLTADCPCEPTVEVVPPSPTQRQMRTWLRLNRPDLGVGTRGFIPRNLVTVYREAHGLPTN